MISKLFGGLKDVAGEFFADDPVGVMLQL